MSCVGTMMGFPCAGERMLFVLIIRTRASICASMESTNNILSPAHGRPIIVPSQDIVLGLYYMTRERAYAHGGANEDPQADGYFAGHFGSPKEVRMAYDHGALHLQAKIKVRMEPGGTMINSTAGRVLLFEGGIPKKIPFAMVNKNLGKKELNELIDNCYR